MENGPATRHPRTYVLQPRRSNFGVKRAVAAQSKGCGSENADEESGNIPKCALAVALAGIFMKIIGLRIMHGSGKRILLQKMDAKSTLIDGWERCVRTLIEETPFRRLTTTVRVARLFEGGGAWSLTKSSQHIGRATPVVTEAAKYVPIAKSTGKAGVLLPPGCEVWRMQSKGREDLAWVMFFMNDATTVEIKMCDA